MTTIDANTGTADCVESGLISPYGGRLIDRLAREDVASGIRAAGELPSINLSARSLCDLELLATGGFSPLDRFMGAADYASVLDRMRLADGTIFPIPITLPVDPGAGISIGRVVSLRDASNEVIASMRIDEIYEWDCEREAQQVFGTTDRMHPTVAEMASWGRFYVSGPLNVFRLPRHYDFPDLRLSPLETRARLSDLGYGNVVAFQTRNPLHRVHEELTKRAAARIDGALMLHPVVGLTKPGDVDHFVRVRTYRALVEKHYDPSRTLLGLLPLAMRMAGPREAVWHAIVRRNFGANHFIVGRDHAGPGRDSSGTPFYGRYDSQQLLARLGPEIDVTMVAFHELVYWPEKDRYEEVDRVPAGVKPLTISGSQVRNEYLAKGRPLPGWFTRSETAAELQRLVPAAADRGFCVWLTGLSGAGKSTIAEILAVRLLEAGRRVTVLDGDMVRTCLSSELGYSRQDRDTNVRRIGFVAKEIVHHHGAVLCPVISPYQSTREEVRQLVGPDRFLLVYVDTPLATCEERDVKGLYRRARQGELKGLTGVDDPYEPPVTADLVLKTTAMTAVESAALILDHLVQRGFVRPE